MTTRTMPAGLLSALLLGTMTMAVACGGPDPTPTPAPTSTPTAVPDEPVGPEPTPTATVDPFTEKWDNLLAAAQAEGTVQILTTDTGVPPILDHFTEKFGIKAVLGTSGGSDSTNRVLAERQGGRYTVDINNAGSGSSERLSQAGVLTPIEQLLFHPDAYDFENLRFGSGGLIYVDSTKQYVLSTCFRLLRPVGIFYNTENVAPDEVVTSYEDFLRPELKGRVALADISVDGATGSRTSVYRLLGPEYLEAVIRLHHENIVPHGDSQGPAGLARGKWDYAFGGEQSDFEGMMAVGLPIGQVEISGKLVADPRCQLGVFDTPANPNAAQFFLNWWMSREGQLAVQRLRTQRVGRESFSYRLDVPQGGIPDDKWKLVQEVEEFALDIQDDAYWAARDDSRELMRRVYDELGILI